MQVLDARDPTQIKSVSHIDADLGVGNRRLLVLSGIALTDWKLDSDELSRGEILIRLGHHASSLEQWSTHVGLASISNDESSFVFAVDTARIELDTVTNELLLFVNLALLGEWSFLGRISYQVVLTVVRFNPQVAGTITWAKSIFSPPNGNISTLAGHISIVANKYERIIPEGEGFIQDRLTPMTPGQLVRLDIVGDDYVAHYRIDNPPMGIDLRVTVAVDEVFGAAPDKDMVLGQVGGPWVFKLTGSEPAVDGINFALWKTRPR